MKLSAALQQGTGPATGKMAIWRKDERRTIPRARGWISGIGEMLASAPVLTKAGLFFRGCLFQWNSSVSS